MVHQRFGNVNHKRGGSQRLKGAPSGGPRPGMARSKSVWMLDGQVSGPLERAGRYSTIGLYQISGAKLGTG